MADRLPFALLSHSAYCLDARRQSLPLRWLPLARIMHTFSTAVPQSSALTALRFLALLDVLHEYACGMLRRAPSQRGVCGTLLQKPR